VLRVAAASVGLDELETLSREDHRQMFMAFVAGLLGDYDRYLSARRSTSLATASATEWPGSGSTPPSTLSSCAT